MYSTPLYRLQNLGAASTLGATRQVGWIDSARFFVEQYQFRVQAPIGNPPMDNPPRLGAWPTYAMYGPPQPNVLQRPPMAVGDPVALFPARLQPRNFAPSVAQAAYYLRLPYVQTPAAPALTTLLQFRYDP